MTSLIIEARVTSYAKYDDIFRTYHLYNLVFYHTKYTRSHDLMISGIEEFVNTAMV